MIVISGALVLVALVLLVIGLISTALGFVYASIAVSVVSFVFLLIGILQRRGEQLPEGATSAGTPPPLPGAPGAPVAVPPSASDVEGVTAIIPASRQRPVAAAPAEPVQSLAPEAPVADVAPLPEVVPPAGEAVSGSVLVVQGRPRYHVSGCRYLTGKDAQEVPVEQARADGFSACGVCKPDAVLSTSAAPDTVADEVVDEPIAPVLPAEPATDPVVDPVEPVAPARRTARKAPAKQAPAAPVRKAAAPVKRATAAKAPAKKAPAAPVKKAAEAPVAKKAPAKKAAPAKAGTTGSKAVAPVRKAVKKAPAKKPSGS